MSSHLHTCRSCGNQFHGRFCNACGEKVIHPDDRRLQHLAGELFKAITFADSKLLRTLKLILFRPGMHSSHYAKGIRVRYMNPVSLFFLCNLIYFLLPRFQTFTTTLKNQVEGNVYATVAADWVDYKIEKSGISYEAFEEQYNSKTTQLSKLLIIVFVAIFSLFNALIHFPPGRYFADHFVLSLEFMSYVLFYLLLVFPLPILLVIIFGQFAGHDWRFLLNNEFVFLLWVVLAGMLYFFLRAEQAFYGGKVLKIIANALLMLLAAILSVFIYRFILFVATMLVL